VLVHRTYAVTGSNWFNKRFIVVGYLPEAGPTSTSAAWLVLEIDVRELLPATVFDVFLRRLFHHHRNDGEQPCRS
jgi:hypothetical protein